MDISVISEKLKQQDYLFLQALYTLRCLSIKQAYQQFYRESGITLEAFVKERVTPFLKLNLIESTYTNTQYALSITNTGIEVISSYFNIPVQTMDESGKIKNRYTAAEIRLSTKLMNHQIELNEFVLSTQKLLTKYRIKKIEYFDEKYMSKYKTIRPDGMLTIPGIDLFLEMDMGTESKRQLLEKWERYRMFLSKKEFIETNNKIIVLFILDIKKELLQKRKNLVRSSIMETLIDALPDGFDIYIGTKEELEELLIKKILPSMVNKFSFESLVMQKILNEKFGYKYSAGSSLSNVFYDSPYAYYMRRLNPNGKILVENKKVQEFLVDEYFFSPLSVLSRIQYHEKHSALFKNRYKRDILYIVIVKNLKEVYEDIVVSGIVETGKICFTTPKRLASMPMHQALVTFDSSKNIFNFTDSSFTKREYMGNLDQMLDKKKTP